jgi:hypothetical protein
MIATLDKREIGGSKALDTILEYSLVHSRAQLADKSVTTRNGIQNNFKKQFETERSTLAMATLRWAHLTVLILQLCSRQSPAFRSCLQETVALTPENEKDVRDLMSMVDIDNVTGTSLHDLLARLDWLITIAVNRWLLTESFNRNNLSYISWTLSMIREVGSGNVDVENGIPILSSDHYYSNGDTTYGKNELVLALSPLQARKGWFDEIFQQFPREVRRLGVNRYFGALINLPWYGFAILQFLYLRRNQSLLPSVKILSKTALANADYPQVKVRDCWMVDFFTLQPGLLVRDSSATLSKPDLIKPITDVALEVYDLSPWNNSVYSLVALGPRDTAAFTKKQPFLVLPKGKVDDKALQDIIISQYELALQSFPGGSGQRPPDESVRDRMLSISLLRSKKYDDSSFQLSEREFDKDTGRQVIPVFINYKNLLA